MTPPALAALHALAFPQARAWTRTEFEDLLAQPHVDLQTANGGFALSRTVAGESELLTLAVHPLMRRRGIASGLVRAWLDGLAPGDAAFLEVAADNAAARALYDRFGFTRAATRHGYYARPGGTRVDGLVLRRG